MSFKFHERPLPLVCVLCGEPSWINHISEDGKRTGYFCTRCHVDTTVRLMTQMERDSRVLKAEEAMKNWPIKTATLRAIDRDAVL